MKTEGYSLPFVLSKPRSEEECIGHNPNTVHPRIRTLFKELKQRNHYGVLGPKLPWCFRSRSMSIWHGMSTPWKTKYFVRQHKYIGWDSESNPGFIEVLEILNPPSGRRPIVIHRFLCDEGSTTFEFDSVARAIEQCESAIRMYPFEVKPRDYPGCMSIEWHKRGDECIPWYYEPPEEERDEPAQKTG